MASKPKPRPGGASSSGGQGHREKAEFLLGKGRLKEAVKEAKLAHRAEPSAENRRLLENAYFQRAHQLKDDGKTNEAREVSGHLLELGIEDSALIEPTVDLLLSLGMSGPALSLQGRVEAPDARDRLARRAADQAVIHPGQASAAPAEVREGAQRVRKALEAVEAGDEEAAKAALRDESRNSPWADWRLLVRGLAAFKRGDDAEYRANWGRLEPDRAPSRIARALTALADPAQSTAPTPDLTSLERVVFKDSVLGPLRKVADLAAQGEWTEVVAKLGPVRNSLERIDPALAERLTRILYDPFIRAASDLDYHDAERLIKHFTRAAAPLPIDPRWNRLWAIAWEGPHGRPDHAEPFWRAYLEDLKVSPALNPDERPTAQALVLTHLGAQLVDEVEPPEFAPKGRRNAKERRRAVDCLEEALRLDPSYRPAYEELRDAYHAWDEPRPAAEVNRRLLAAFPDDADALTELVVHHLNQDEPAEARRYALDVRRLRPLDEEARELERVARESLARRLSMDGRADEARTELEAAGALNPKSALKPGHLARRILVELKDDRRDRAEALIAEAQADLVEPTPLWLALAIEASRHEAPKADRDRFEALWTDAVTTRKKRSETAGAMALLLSGFLAVEQTYPGLEEHAKQVADYLRKTTRTTYRREDLAAVCALLGLRPAERPLFRKMIGRGLRLFPEAPEFPMMLGTLELEENPFGGGAGDARKHFDDAFRLARAEADANPEAAAMLPKIQETLSMLAAAAESPLAEFPFMFGPDAPAPGALLDMLKEMSEDMGVDFDELMELDDDEFDAADFNAAPPAPPATRPRAPKKRKKR